jgi:hypothetical protein
MLCLAFWSMEEFGEIERYLDELFDRMAGRGAAGRRALAEAEDHLRAAAADATARGLPTSEAELEAVARFGPPAAMASRIGSAAASGRVSRAVSVGWLLAGLAAAGLGVAYLAASGRLGWQSPAWTCTNFLRPPCYSIGGPALRDAQGAVIAATTGTALFLGRWVAVRYGGLAPVGRGFASVAGLVVGLAALGFGLSGQTPALHDGVFSGLFWRPLPLHISFIVAATVLMEVLAAVSLGNARPRYSWRSAVTAK